MTILFSVVPPPLNLTGSLFWLDPSDLSTLFQEITGASASTPAVVDGVVGTARNKGTAGGYFVASSTTNRPILRQSGALYYLDFSTASTWGADNFRSTVTYPSATQIWISSVLSFPASVGYTMPGIDSGNWYNANEFLPVNSVYWWIYYVIFPYDTPTASYQSTTSVCTYWIDGSNGYIKRNNLSPSAPYAFTGTIGGSSPSVATVLVADAYSGYNNLYQLIIYPTPLVNAAQVITFIGTKAGLTI